MVNIELKRAVSGTIDSNPGWSLVFGRRKVGKTYLLENFVAHDVYMAVRLDGSVWAKGIPMGEFGDLTGFPEMVRNLLAEGRTVVIDEFQRLPMRVLEDIARAHPAGRLVLSGSSMRVSASIMGRNSPLLGLLRPFKVGLVSPRDLLSSLSGQMTPLEALQHAPVLRDPWTVPFFEGKGFLESIVNMVPHMVPGLVGEIFTEDERELTRTYSSILAIVGSGDGDPKKVATKLHSRGITATNASANVIPYMKNMVEMGLLERTKVYGKRRYRYSIPSFPMTLFYYLESRYALTDGTVPYEEVRPTAENALRFGIEGFIADLFAEMIGGRKELIKEADREVDVLVTVRGRPALVAEVKWGRATKGDVSAFLTKVEPFDCQKVFVSRRPVDTDEVEVLTPKDLVDKALG